MVHATYSTLHLLRNYPNRILFYSRMFMQELVWSEEFIVLYFYIRLLLSYSDSIYLCYIRTVQPKVSLLGVLLST